MYDVETLEERCGTWKIRVVLPRKIDKAYNKKVKPQTLCVGDLLVKTIAYIQKELNAYKIASNWE